MGVNNRRKVYGVGVNDFPTNTNIDGKDMWEYKSWWSMVRRCYDEKYKAKNPTYNECTVEDHFLSFTNFYNHITTLIGYDNEDYELDKDLLVKGNTLNKSVFYRVVLNSKTGICYSKRDLAKSPRNGKLPEY